jgi:hypothetical protein
MPGSISSALSNEGSRILTTEFGVFASNSSKEKHKYGRRNNCFFIQGALHQQAVAGAGNISDSAVPPPFRWGATSSVAWVPPSHFKTVLWVID